MSRQAELRKLRSKGKVYREEFLSSTVRGSIAYQVQALRTQLDMTQQQFAEKVNKRQTQISRLENAESGGVNLQSLIDIASELGIALLVKFVDYGTFLTANSDFSEAALRVTPIEKMALDDNEASLVFKGAKRLLQKIIADAQSVGPTQGSGIYMRVQTASPQIAEIGVSTTWSNQPTIPLLSGLEMPSASAHLRIDTSIQTTPSEISAPSTSR